MDVIYLDNNATTQPAPEVVDAMLRVLKDGFGNPSSSHIVGQRASFAVAQARLRVASCLGAEPGEIIFTSGGTESDNLAIRSVLQLAPHKRHVVTTTVEHEAVYRLVEQLEREGYAATYVNVNVNGELDASAVRAALRPETAVVSVMLAHNETGVLFPIEEIAASCRERGIPLHCDAVQAVGKVPVNVARLGIDLLSLSAHKFHGPKGCGALYARRPLRLPAQIIGGHQEGDIRGGTENVPGIVGLGVAAELVQHQVVEEQARMSKLRDELERRLCGVLSAARVIAGGAPRLPNTTMISFERLAAEALLLALSERGICASAGSACHSGSLKPSRVLAAMGVPAHVAVGAIRFSLSRYTTAAEVERLLEVLPEVVRKLESASLSAS